MPPQTSFRTIWQLTWPQMLMMFCIFCIGLCDVWVAGRIGTDVQAALGLVAQCNMFLQVVIMSISSGAMAAISQSLGSGRVRRARRYVGIIILGALGLGGSVALIAYMVRMPLLCGLMQTPESILPIVLSYFTITLFTLPFSYLQISTGSIFRATRQVIQPLYVTGAMALCNLFGNLGFGLGYFGLPAYGYLGIAWTTFACVLLGAVSNTCLLWRTPYLRLQDFPSLRWIRRGAPYLIKVALPAGASHIVWQTGYAVLIALAASLPYGGVDALAGMTAGMRVEALLFLPGMAFNMTASVLVGNALGANNPEEAFAVGRRLAIMGSVMMSGIALLLWPFIGDMAAVVTGGGQAQAIAIDYLHLNFLATPFSIGSVILGGVMVGAGATRFNLIVYGGSFWLVRLPLAWFLGHYLWQNAMGIFVGMLASQVIQCIIMVWVIHRFNWTRFTLRKIVTV